MLLSLENAAPEIKESVEYQKAVKSQLKFAQGVVEEKIREEEQLRYREMMKRFDEKFSASVRFSKALKISILIRHLKNMKKEFLVNRF